ncbi:hypothetical protein [Salinithrix halophila]|uniref:Uncharacterized protein n=1 Tax=Salinithrix halophila TaxID=1485204 RepID=A0ABV8JGG7_9BACL
MIKTLKRKILIPVVAATMLSSSFLPATPASAKVDSNDITNALKGTYQNVPTVNDLPSTFNFGPNDPQHQTGHAHGKFENFGLNSYITLTYTGRSPRSIYLAMDQQGNTHVPHFLRHNYAINRNGGPHSLFLNLENEDFIGLIADALDYVDIDRYAQNPSGFTPPSGVRFQNTGRGRNGAQRSEFVIENAHNVSVFNRVNQSAHMLSMTYNGPSDRYLGNFDLTIVVDRYMTGRVELLTVYPTRQNLSNTGTNAGKRPAPSSNNQGAKRFCYQVPGPSGPSGPVGRKKRSEEPSVEPCVIGNSEGEPLQYNKTYLFSTSETKPIAVEEKVTKESSFWRTLFLHGPLGFIIPEEYNPIGWGGSKIWPESKKVSDKVEEVSKDLASVKIESTTDKNGNVELGDKVRIRFEAPKYKDKPYLNTDDVAKEGSEIRRVGEDQKDKPGSLWTLEQGEDGTSLVHQENGKKPLYFSMNGLSKDKYFISLVPNGDDKKKKEELK